MLHDLHFAFRSLRKHPAFTAVAVLSLALGIGANTTIFSGVDAFLIRPLSYPDADRLVRIWTANPERGWTEASSSLPDVLDWRDQSRAVDIAAFWYQGFNVAGAGTPERLDGVRAAANFTAVLGVPPQLGRWFTRDQEVEGKDRVAVLSAGLWHRKFGADPAVVGQTLMLDGLPYAVIGVMPTDFKFPDRDVDLWVPLGRTGREPRESRSISVVGRLREGVSFERGGAELAGIARRLEETYPAADRGMTTRLVPLARQLYDDQFRQAAWICTVAVAFVLLIACANVANLMLARGAAREREVAVRSALGAGRVQLISQVVCESLVLALVGAMAGALLAYWGVAGMKSIMPDWFPRKEDIALNARALGYTLGISVVSGVLFGLAPALRAARPDLRESLTEGSRGATGGGKGGRLRSVLVVSEMSLALVLLVGAGLLIRSFVYLRTVDLGYRPTGVVTMRTTLAESHYPDSVRVGAFYQHLLERLRAIPGVQAAGATTILPSDGNAGTYYSVVGEPPPEEGKAPIASYRGILPGYFATLGIPVLQGRTFSDADQMGSPPVAIINQTLARRHWPEKSPIGERLQFSSGARDIVGVVNDTRDFGPDDPPGAMVFLPELQRGYRSVSIVLRVVGDPAAPLAGIALVLAVVGVYGVMAYVVTQRTREMGIRVALGASRHDVIRAVLVRGMRLAAVGLALGLLLAAGVTRALSAFLFGVRPYDIGTFGGVTLALTAAALVACYLPARRATRVDPIVVLRSE